MDIIGLCSKLKTISVSNELFFSCNDFFNLLKMDGDIGYIDCVITPFYISNNKRYELYEYELVMSSTESFEQYMEIVTGHMFDGFDDAKMFLAIYH